MNLVGVQAGWQELKNETRKWWERYLTSNCAFIVLRDIGRIVGVSKSEGEIERDRDRERQTE